MKPITVAVASRCLLRHPKRLQFILVLLLTAIPVSSHAQFTYTTNNGALTITGYTGTGGDVTIPEMIDGLAVTTVGRAVFSGGSSLTNIVIPHSVSTVGPEAFLGCTTLLSITVDGLNPVYSSVEGVLFNKDGSILIAFPPGKTNHYSIPNSVSVIGNEAFRECRLRSVAIGNNVTRLGASAFSLCRRLSSISVAGSVTNIGGSVFSGAGTQIFPDDFSVVLEEGIRSIAPQMFQGCTELRSIVIPNTVTNIGGSAFYECYRLEKIMLPNGVVTLAGHAFYSCQNLTNIIIPSSVTRVGDRVFFACSSLRNVYFEGDIPTIFNSPLGRVFEYPATVYYLPGTVGWQQAFGGTPTAPWLRSDPVILAKSQNFGIKTNTFSFRISWATNIPVVIEASADLASWSPMQTNNLINGWTDFTEQHSLENPNRIYRVRGQ